MNNEIAYIEFGQFPLVCDVKCRQLKFWITLPENLTTNSHLQKLIDCAIEKRIPYIMYYKRLAETYRRSRKFCNTTLRQEFLSAWSSKIEKCATEDGDSKLGVYKQVNPNLKPFTTDQPIPEFERINITRYRTGSHNLHIEKGRHNRTARENRLCISHTGIQTLNHVLFLCPLTSRLPDISNLNEFFSKSPHDINTYIQSFTKTLKIKTH